MKIFTNFENYKENAIALTEHLGCDFITDPKSIDPAELTLIYDEKGLSLNANGLCVQGDFSDMKRRLKQSNLQNELLVKSSRIKSLSRPHVIYDATAGLGEDSILLAASGHEVTMFEQDKVIAALLKDALLRAAEDEDLKDIVSRMTLIEGNFIETAPTLPSPDVIYLDPMFPGRTKSGLIKKKFQLLQKLESPCSNEDELLGAAIDCHPRKIVIKRPLKGPNLSGRKPDYSITGKAIRYDCIFFT